MFKYNLLMLQYCADLCFAHKYLHVYKNNLKINNFHHRFLRSRMRRHLAYSEESENKTNKIGTDFYDGNLC